jgi:hypothetical protein
LIRKAAASERATPTLLFELLSEHRAAEVEHVTFHFRRGTQQRQSAFGLVA